jgi:hypothetical protein
MHFVVDKANCACFSLDFRLRLGLRGTERGAGVVQW